RDRRRLPDDAARRHPDGAPAALPLARRGPAGREVLREPRSAQARRVHAHEPRDRLVRRARPVRSGAVSQRDDVFPPGDPARGRVPPDASAGPERTLVRRAFGESARRPRPAYRDPDGVPAARGHAVSEGVARRLRVMVVDDSAVARQVLTAVLSAAGMDVRSAPDPLFALNRLERWDPDVLVLDLEMPRMDGLTFLKRLRKEGDLPVVICSGTTEGRGEKALRALDEGAAEVVTKPKTAVRDFLFESSVMLVDAVTAAAETRPTLRARRRQAATPSLGPAPRAASRRELLAIGASTGGPEAIRK